MSLKCKLPPNTPCVIKRAPTCAATDPNLTRALRRQASDFKTKPDADDEAIELTVRELNLLLEGIDLWGNQPHKVLAPRFVT